MLDVLHCVRVVRVQPHMLHTMNGIARDRVGPIGSDLEQITPASLVKSDSPCPPFKDHAICRPRGPGQVSQNSRKSSRPQSLSLEMTQLFGTQSLDGLPDTLGLYWADLHLQLLHAVVISFLPSSWIRSPIDDMSTRVIRYFANGTTNLAAPLSMPVTKMSDAFAGTSILSLLPAYGKTVARKMDTATDILGTRCWGLLSLQSLFLSQTFSHSAASDRAISGRGKQNLLTCFCGSSEQGPRNPSRVEQHRSFLHWREATSRCCSSSCSRARRNCQAAHTLWLFACEVRASNSHSARKHCRFKRLRVFCSVFLSLAECWRLASFPILILERLASARPSRRRVVILPESTLVYLIQHLHGCVCREVILDPRVAHTITSASHSPKVFKNTFTKLSTTCTRVAVSDKHEI